MVTPFRAALLGLALAAAAGCEAPRKKLPDVVLRDIPYLEHATPDSAYLQAFVLAAEAGADDTAALSPGDGRFEYAASPDFKDMRATAWRTAGPPNGYRLTGALPRPAAGGTLYVRCRFGPNRSFLRAGKTDTVTLND